MLAFLAFVFAGVLLLYGGFTTLDARDHITPGTSCGAALALLGAIFIFVGSGLCWWLLYIIAAAEGHTGKIKGEIQALQPIIKKKPGKKAKAAAEPTAEQSEPPVPAPTGEPDQPTS